MHINSLLAAACLSSVASLALAESHSLTADTLAAYAAMSKLEANKAEAAGAVMLAAIPDLPDDVREEAAEDYASDLAQMDGYIEALNGMGLTEDQSAALNSFAEQWGAVSAEGTTLIAQAADTPEFHARVFAWWESLDDLDDLIDDALEEILEANGISFE